MCMICVDEAAVAVGIAIAAAPWYRAAWARVRKLSGTENSVKKIIAAAILLLSPARVSAQLTPPGCASPPICQSFSVPSITILPGGSITYGDGAVSTSPVNGGTGPIGPAGGNLSGTYPNPTVGSLGAISGANLTNLTGANVVGDIAGQAGSALTAASVPQSGVNLSTVTAALAGKLSSSSGVPPSLIDLSTVTTALAGKLATNGIAVAVLSSGVDLSTVTSALAGKLSTTGQAASVAASGVDLSTVTSALAGKLSSSSTVPPGLVDLSTVTSALAGKLDAAGVPPQYVDLSTVTAALAGKLSSSSGIPPSLVDLSTVTSALSGKLATNGTAVAVLASGVDLSTVTSALAGKLSNTATVPTGLIDLSTVTSALAGKLPTNGTAVAVLASGVDLSTVTSALAGKLSNASTVPPSLIDLSTVSVGINRLAATGLLMGGQLSTNTDTTKFDIAAGTGLVVNAYSDPFAPTLKVVSWPARTGITVDDLAPVAGSFIAIDADGNTVQSSSQFTPSQLRDLIYLGIVIHPFGTGVVGVESVVMPGYSTALQFQDFAFLFGILNVAGNEYSAAGASLQLQRSAGSYFYTGSNFTNSRKNPNVLDVNAENPANLFYRFTNSSGVWTQAQAGTSLRPNVYDTLMGTAAVTASSFTLQAIFFSGNPVATVIQYGQAVYPSLAAAQTASAIAPVNTISPNILTFRGYVAVKQGATDLSDPTQALFLPAGRFGLSSSGGGGGGSGEVNTASNVGSTGVGLFKQKSGVDLQFKNVAPASNRITVTEDVPSNTAQIDVVSANIAPSQANVNLSTVTSALAGKLSNTVTVPTGLVDLSTVTSALAGKLSNSSGVPPSLIDLSTVTSALSGKLSTTGQAASVASSGVDLSTITTALSGKLSNTVTVPTGLINLSTITTALALKANDSLVVHLAGVETITGNKDFRTITSSLTVQGSALSVGGSTLVVTGGMVGVGTSSPSTDLHVIQTTSMSGIREDHYSDDAVGNAVIGRKARGTSASPTAVLASDRLMTFGGLGYDGAFPSSSTANIQFQAAENFGASNHGTDILFNSFGNSGSAVAERMRIANTGSVGIGVSSPAATLEVNGSAMFGSGATKSSFTATGFLNMASGSSVTVSGAGGFVGNGQSLTGVQRSSETDIPNTTFTNTTFGVAFATVTLVTRGNPVVFRVSGTGQTTNNSNYEIGVMVDGALTSQLGSRAFFSTRPPANNVDFSISCSVLLENVPAGSHTFALLLLTGAGTGTILSDATHYSQFVVTETP